MSAHQNGAEAWIRLPVASPDSVTGHVTLLLLDRDGQPTPELLAINRALMVAEEQDRRQAATMDRIQVDPEFY